MTASSELLEQDSSDSNNSDDAIGHEFTEAGPAEKNWQLGLMAVGDQGIVSATNFLTTVLVAKLCTEHELGIFALAWTIMNLIKTAQERAISAPYVVFTHRDDVDSTAFMGSSLVHQLVFASLASIVLCTLAGLFAIRGTLQGFSSALVILAVVCPVVLMRDHVRAICAAHFQFPTSIAMNVTVLAVQLGSIGILAMIGRLSIPWVFAAIGIACLAVPFVAVKGSPNSYRFEKTRLWSDWLLSWNYARWLVVARSFGIAAPFIVPWIVVAHFGEAAAGRFGVCLSLVGLSLMLVMGLNSFFQARAVRDYQSGGTARLVKSLAVSLAVFLSGLGTISLLFWFAGAWLLGLLYDPRFSDLADVVFWLSINTLLVSVTMVAANGMAALGKSMGYVWGEAAYFLASLTGSLLLIPKFGLAGAAWAFVAGGVAGVIVQAITLYFLMTRAQRESQRPATSVA